MVDKIGLMHAEEFYRYDFGPTHPLRPLRLELTYSLFDKLGLLESKILEIFKPETCSEKDLKRVHSQKYIDAVKKLSINPNDDSIDAYLYGLGKDGDTPAFKYMYETSKLICGASIKAADLVWNKEFNITFNPAGGLHHAHANKASGFCIFNDIAVAIKHLKTIKNDIKIAYLDIDCHHGDGVQAIFYDDPNVLTISYINDLLP